MAVTTSSEFFIREANSDDAPAIAKLGVYVFSKTFGHSVTAEQLQAYLDESYSTAATLKDITNPSKTLMVACSSSEGGSSSIVGFALLTRGSTEPCVSHLQGTIELQRIYVHPDHAGRGLGKKLALSLEDLAREAAFEYMWLGVWEENHAAQRVYEKLGYEVVGSHVFNVGGDLQTDHIMIKRL